MSSFSDWLDDQVDRDDPTGDLARDHRDDPVPMIGGWVGPSRDWMQDGCAEDAYDGAEQEWGES
jgi:hypothetical protein